MVEKRRSTQPRETFRKKNHQDLVGDFYEGEGRRKSKVTHGYPHERAEIFTVL